MWNPKNGSNKIMCKTEIESQKTNVVTKGGWWGGKHQEIGTDRYTYTTVYKMDN